MGGESPERRQRNIAGWSQSFRELCCSSGNTKEAAEESIKYDDDGQESEDARLPRLLAMWQAFLVVIKNKKDKLSMTGKEELLAQLEGMKAEVLELIKISEQEILSATVNDRESIKAQLRGCLAELQARLVEIMNEKDELSAQRKRCFQWKHSKRLHQLEEEMATVLERKDMLSEFIQKFEQHMSRRYPSASAAVNNTQSDGLELPTDGYFVISESMKQAACEMLVALEDQEVHLIGLVGIRGVGKTTLAKLVARKAQRSRLFDLVLVIDSHSKEQFEPDGNKIWQQVAVLLGVQDTPQSAKSRLNKKLDEGKKILIILDDVWWKEPDLEALGGIPYGQSCKILVITCLPQVCAGIGCHAIIQLNGLTVEEAREWYKHIPSRIMDPESFFKGEQSIFQTFKQHRRVLRAKKELGDWETEIVGASQGLPFSVVTTGEKLHKQESTDPTQNLVRCINEHVFNYLKLHYDYLSDQESKSFFILCSHFPEDYCPTLEHFTRYACGALQRSFESIGSIHEARRKIHGLISDLRSYSLLEVQKDQVVKMPDLFRRLAHWIAEQDGQKILAGSNSNGFLDIFPSLSTACVSNKQLKNILSHDALECTKLENLIAFTKEEEEEEDEEVKDPATYPTSVFERMVNLTVLFLFDHTSSVETRKCLSLEGIQLLMDLRTLQLQGYKLRGLSSLGKLTKLEILCFIYCDIDELLDALGELSNLKLLELSCVKLHASVSLDWVGQLSKLEELYMTDASIEVPDVNSSINLKVKHLELNGVKGFRNLFPNFSKQGLHQLEFLKLDKCYNLECLVNATELKEVQQDVEDCIIETTNQIKAILGFPNLTNLELRNFGSLSGLWKGKAHISLEKLKVMVIHSCGLTCESLFPTHVVEGLNQLEILHIFRCSDLKSIIMKDYSVRYPCLPKLTTLKIESCSKLEYVFPVTIAEGPPQLRELEIKSCNNLQHVFIYNAEASNQQTHAFVLPELKRLCFEKLSALRKIREGADTLEAPLEELDVSFCYRLEPFSVTPKKGDHPRLKKLNLEECGRWHVEEEISSLRENSASLSRFMEYGTLKHLRLRVRLKLTALWRGRNQVIGMQNLAHLELSNITLRYVFTPTSVRNLPQLMHLSITSCSELEYIFEDDQPSGLIIEETRTRYRPTYFPNLAEIEIKNCKKLKSVFPARLVQFPKLKSFIVENSASLTQIFTDQEAHAGVKYHQSSKLEFPMLRKLSLVKLPSLLCFASVGYHCIFPSLCSLTIKECPKNNTRIMPDELSRCFYGKTEALAHLAASSSTSAADTAQPLIPLRFSGQDYDIWCVEMKTYLASQDLWGIVEKGVGRLSTNEDKKRDAQALSIIQQSLTKKELHQMIIGEYSARNTWNILREKYQGDRQCNKKTKASSPLIRYVNVLDRLEELFVDESDEQEEQTESAS